MLISETRIWPLESSIETILVHAEHIYVGTADGDIVAYHLQDLRHPEAVLSSEHHRGRICSLEISIAETTSGTGKFLYSASEGDGCVLCWDVTQLGAFPSLFSSSTSTSQRPLLPSKKYGKMNVDLQGNKMMQRSNGSSTTSQHQRKQHFEHLMLELKTRHTSDMLANYRVHPDTVAEFEKNLAQEKDVVQQTAIRNGSGSGGEAEVEAALNDDPAIASGVGGDEQGIGAGSFFFYPEEDSSSSTKKPQRSDRPGYFQQLQQVYAEDDPGYSTNGFGAWKTVTESKFPLFSAGPDFGGAEALGTSAEPLLGSAVSDQIARFFSTQQADPDPSRNLGGKNEASKAGASTTDNKLPVQVVHLSGELHPDEASFAEKWGFPLSPTSFLQNGENSSSGRNCAGGTTSSMANASTAAGTSSASNSASCSSSSSFLETQSGEGDERLGQGGLVGLTELDQAFQVDFRTSTSPTPAAPFSGSGISNNKSANPDSVPQQQEVVVIPAPALHDRGPDEELDRDEGGASSEASGASAHRPRSTRASPSDDVRTGIYHRLLEVNRSRLRNGTVPSKGLVDVSAEPSEDSNSTSGEEAESQSQTQTEEESELREDGTAHVIARNGGGGGAKEGGKAASTAKEGKTVGATSRKASAVAHQAAGAGSAGAENTRGKKKNQKPPKWKGLAPGLALKVAETHHHPGHSSFDGAQKLELQPVGRIYPHAKLPVGDMVTCKNLGVLTIGDDCTLRRVGFFPFEKELQKAQVREEERTVATAAAAVGVSSRVALAAKKWAGRSTKAKGRSPSAATEVADHRSSGADHAPPGGGDPVEKGTTAGASASSSSPGKRSSPTKKLPPLQGPPGSSSRPRGRPVTNTRAASGSKGNTNKQKDRTPARALTPPAPPKGVLDGFEHHHLTEEERERLKRKREAAAELRSRWEHQNRLMENEQHFFNGDESLRKSLRTALQLIRTSRGQSLAEVAKQYRNSSNPEQAKWYKKIEPTGGFALLEELLPSLGGLSLGLGREGSAFGLGGASSSGGLHSHSLNAGQYINHVGGGGGTSLTTSLLAGPLGGVLGALGGDFLSKPRSRKPSWKDPTVGMAGGGLAIADYGAGAVSNSSGARNHGQQGGQASSPGGNAASSGVTNAADRKKKMKGINTSSQHTSNVAVKSAASSSKNAKNANKRSSEQSGQKGSSGGAGDHGDSMEHPTATSGEKQQKREPSPEPVPRGFTELTVSPALVPGLTSRSPEPPPAAHNANSKDHNADHLLENISLLQISKRKQSNSRSPKRAAGANNDSSTASPQHLREGDHNAAKEMLTSKKSARPNKNNQLPNSNKRKPPRDEGSSTEVEQLEASVDPSDDPSATRIMMERDEEDRKFMLNVLKKKQEKPLSLIARKDKALGIVRELKFAGTLKKAAEITRKKKIRAEAGVEWRFGDDSGESGQIPSASSSSASPFRPVKLVLLRRENNARESGCSSPASTEECKRDSCFLAVGCANGEIFLLRLSDSSKSKTAECVGRFSHCSTTLLRGLVFLGVDVFGENHFNSKNADEQQFWRFSSSDHDDVVVGEVGEDDRKSSTKKRGKKVGKPGTATRTSESSIRLVDASQLLEMKAKKKKPFRGTLAPAARGVSVDHAAEEDAAVEVFANSCVPLQIATASADGCVKVWSLRRAESCVDTVGSCESLRVKIDLVDEFAAPAPLLCLLQPTTLTPHQKGAIVAIPSSHRKATSIYSGSEIGLSHNADLVNYHRKTTTVMKSKPAGRAYRIQAMAEATLGRRRHVFFGGGEGVLRCYLEDVEVVGGGGGGGGGGGAAGGVEEDRGEEDRTCLVRGTDETAHPRSSDYSSRDTRGHLNSGVSHEEFFGYRVGVGAAGVGADRTEHLSASRAREKTPGEARTAKKKRAVTADRG